MIHLARHHKYLFLLCFAGFCINLITGTPRGNAAATHSLVTDSIYTNHHPRLMFTNAEIPALHDRVRDGGNDDASYLLIRNATEFLYPGLTMEELLDDDYGLETIPNLGLAGFLESPKDTAALALGRSITLYIARNYDVNTDDFGSSLRLRSLALGYDLFFENAAEAERDSVRDEIVDYIDLMLGGAYRVWPYRPYLGNHSVTVAASLGLAAICLDGEIDPFLVTAALNYADKIIGNWLLHQLDEDGAYNEGVVYGSWSMRVLIYYFDARKRYDGYDYSSNARIRNMEKWFAYELLPEGSGRTNNLNACNYDDYILSRHTTYFDWAQAEWDSGLAAWLWQHTAGDYGFDWGMQSDNAATILWNQTLSPELPETVLPGSYMWLHRGLYYYRSGWEMGPGSNDVVFSFYSGNFQGAHAQEDQGNFTLYAYGVKFAIDHGSGSTAKQSEAHNIILIDNLGQHNAGNSIGTDGTIQEYLLSDYADYLIGDQTDAYTTYSKWNNPDVPFPGTDWSWGYSGSNPVDHALRTVVAVHDEFLPPYFLVIDDIEKDGYSHKYDWRLHTLDTNLVDISANPIKISNGGSYLDIHLIEPSFESVQKTVVVFDNRNNDPDASVIELSVTDTNPDFNVLLLPANGSAPTPLVTKESFAWGYALTLDWGGGVIDVFARNVSGGTITYAPGVPASANRSAGSDGHGATAATNDSITTDAVLALLQLNGNRLVKYLLAHASEFTFNDTSYVNIANGFLSCGLSGNTIQIDRHDADFTFYAPGVTDVFYRSQKIYVNSQDGYITRDPFTEVAVQPHPAFSIAAKIYPNPFNPSTSIHLQLPVQAEVRVTIYDSSGRLVKRLWRGSLPRGGSILEWNGMNEDGVPLASGVYFLKIQSRGYATNLKLVLVK